MASSVPAPGFIEVEIGSYCNRRCAWCPNGWHDRGSLARSQSMKQEVWRGLLDDLSQGGYRGWFAFHNYNEPMADPQLLPRIAEARAALPRAKLELHTNGDFLTPRRLQGLLEAGLDLVRVTLYPANRAAFAPPDPQRIVRFFEKLRVRPRPLWTKASKLERHGRLGRLQLVVRAPRVDHYLDRLGDVGLEGLRTTPRRTRPCWLPFHSAAIDVHGALKLCCHVYDTTSPDSRPYVMGNVGQTPFSQLWRSGRLAIARAQLARADFHALPGCATCAHATPGWMQGVVKRTWKATLSASTG